jgi:hypothetical protein
MSLVVIFGNVSHGQQIHGNRNYIMAIANHFYNGTTRKYIAIFGSIFNKLSITRDDNSGEEIQRMVVPIAYGPYQKFLARISQDPNLDQKSAITLPRMAFEITSMNYDGQRKIGSTNKFIPSSEFQDQESGNIRYAPAPYNLEFNLYIMVKYSEDGVKIIEQILPFFKPEYTVSAKLIDGLDSLDIPIVLNSVGVEDIYEGDFETRRSMMWTLSFTMKAYYFGPVRNKKRIKFITTNFYSNIDTSLNPAGISTIQPGLTTEGNPTSDITETIPYQDIYVDDDWGYIVLYSEPDNE